MKRKQSLLVIDTPKSCSECELSRYIFNVNGTFCSINGKEVSHIKTKPSTCPLQDTTELLEALEKIGDKEFPYMKGKLSIGKYVAYECSQSIKHDLDKLQRIEEVLDRGHSSDRKTYQLREREIYQILKEKSE